VDFLPNVSRRFTSLDVVSSVVGSLAARVDGEVKVNFTLGQAMKTQRGSRGLALLFP
jgi:hypothetical protein